jgi:hypothetical protein
MFVAGLASAVVGFAVLLNLGGAADRLAAAALPGWITWPWGASPTYYRVVGAALVAMSAFLLGAGLPT